MFRACLPIYFERRSCQNKSGADQRGPDLAYIYVYNCDIRILIVNRVPMLICLANSITFNIVYEDIGSSGKVRHCIRSETFHVI